MAGRLRRALRSKRCQKRLSRAPERGRQPSDVRPGRSGHPGADGAGVELQVLIAVMLVAGAAVYGAYGYAPPGPGRSYHSAYLASVRGYYADTAVARFFYLHEGTGTPVVLISPGDSPAYAWHNQLSVLCRRRRTLSMSSTSPARAGPCFTTPASAGICQP